MLCRYAVYQLEMNLGLWPGQRDVRQDGTEALLKCSANAQDIKG